MSYSDDTVRAKLSALNETQESIVTTSQWIMFHRRNAERTASLWLQRLRDSSVSKRLNLVYLANEVVQQSKARKKDDFLNAFSPNVVEGMELAYKGANNEVQGKLKRVAEVWRQRQIFESRIQEAIEAKIEEIDKTRSSTKKAPLGGTLFQNGTTPSELEALVTLQTSLSRAELAAKPAVTSANNDYEALTNGQQATPTPPVHAARLSSLVKALANAETAVTESLKMRQDLVTELEKLLEQNRAALETEQTQATELQTKKASTETKKREVEDDIMKAMAEEGSTTPTTTPPPAEQNGFSQASDMGITDSTDDFERPEVEPLTPPPIDPVVLDPIAVQNEFEPPVGGEFTMSGALPPPTDQPKLSEALDILSSNSNGAPTSSHSRPESRDSSHEHRGVAKRRKLSRNDDYGDFGDGEDAMGGLDADVVGMLG